MAVKRRRGRQRPTATRAGEQSERDPRTGRRRRRPSGQFRDAYGVHWDIQGFLSHRGIKQAQVSKDTGIVGMSLYTWGRQRFTPLLVFKAMLHLYGGPDFRIEDIPFQVVKRDGPNEREFRLKEGTAAAAAAWDAAHPGWVFVAVRNSDGGTEELVIPSRASAVVRTSVTDSAAKPSPEPVSGPGVMHAGGEEVEGEEGEAADDDPPASVILGGTGAPADVRADFRVLQVPGGVLEFRFTPSDEQVPEEVVHELVRMMDRIKAQRDEALARVTRMTEQATALADEIADLRARFMDAPARLTPVQDADAGDRTAIGYLERLAPHLLREVGDRTPGVNG